MTHPAKKPDLIHIWKFLQKSHSCKVESKLFLPGIFPEPQSLIKAEFQCVY